MSSWPPACPKAGLGIDVETRGVHLLTDDCLRCLQKKEDAKVAEERQRIKWQKDHMYDELHTDDNIHESSNQDRDADFFDDFM